MNPSSGIAHPDPLPFPAPPWLAWGLLLLTFFLHVLAMNAVLGGSIISLVARLRRDEHSRRLAGWIGQVMPTMIAAAITFGVAPLLFLQTLYGRLFFSSAVLMAWFWLAVIPILIIGYYSSYFIAFRKGGRGRLVVGLSIVMALLFLTIAFLYSNNMTLMLRPETFRDVYLSNPGGTNLNISEPTLFPRYLHMVLSALAVAGMLVSFYGLARRRAEEDFGRWAVRYGALWFVVATGLNILVGFWWLGVLPREVIMRFMGQSVVGSVSLALGILLGIGALVMMNLAIGAAEPSGLVRNSGWALLATLVAMIFARDEVRKGMLDIAGFAPTTWIAPQWDVIAIFALLLVGALGVTAWMAFMLLRAKPGLGEP